MDKRFYDAWFDGSTNPITHKTGIGGFIRCPDKLKIIKYHLELPYEKDSRKVEYLALIKLVETLLDNEIYNVAIRTDFKGLAESINRGGSRKYNRLMPSDQITRLHQQAVETLRYLNYYILTWVPREENQIADALSRSN